MDIESTLETISDILPEDLDLTAALDAVSEHLPEVLDLSSFLTEAKSYVPTEIDFAGTMKFMLLFAAGSFLFSLLCRLILGKRSSLNHAVSSAMGILFMYAVTIIIYTFRPAVLMSYVSPLPFMVFAGDYMMVIPFDGSTIPALCHEILSLIILAFLTNLLDTLIPKGRSITGWYLLRLVTILLALGLHILADWAFDTYLPNVLVTYAPVILLGILAAMLLLGIANLFLGAVLAIVDPIMGAIYTFFFSTIVGKQLTKAVATTVILCAVFFVMNYFGYTIILLNHGALLSYIPFGIVMLILWYLIGHIL